MVLLSLSVWIHPESFWASESLNWLCLACAIDPQVNQLTDKLIDKTDLLQITTSWSSNLWAIIKYLGHHQVFKTTDAQSPHLVWGMLWSRCAQVYRNCRWGSSSSLYRGRGWRLPWEADSSEDGRGESGKVGMGNSSYQKHPYEKEMRLFNELQVT